MARLVLLLISKRACPAHSLQVSPENLQWNFSLSSSLGVSQAPLSATLNPNGGIRSTYKIYDMYVPKRSISVLLIRGIAG